MTVRNIKKNLAGAEDLLHGIGVETQSRGGAFYEMHKLDTYVPTYDVTEMQRSSLTFMRLYGTDTAYTDYRRNPTGTVGIPSDLGGVWEPIRSSELPVCGSFIYGAYVFSSDCIVGYNDSFMQWQGDTPKVVAAGATPATSGGIGAGAWVDRTDETLRTDLASTTGAGLVGYQPAGTGAVATTVQSKLRETVSVKDFGAVGDGVTDDTAAIQAAIEYAKTLKSCDVIFLQTGFDYIVTAPIKLYSNVRLVGEHGTDFIGNYQNNKPGIKKTTNTAVAITNFDTGAVYNVDCIFYTEFAHFAGVDYSTGAAQNFYPQQFGFRNLLLKGGASSVVTTAVHMDFGSNMVIEGCDAIGVTHAFYGRNIFVSKLHKVRTSGKIKVSQAATSLILDNCSARNGFYIQGAYYSSLRACTSDGGSGQSAYTFVSCHGVTIDACGAEKNTPANAQTGVFNFSSGNHSMVMINPVVGHAVGSESPAVSVGDFDRVVVVGGDFGMFASDAPSAYDVYGGSNSAITFLNTKFIGSNVLSNPIAATLVGGQYPSVCTYEYNGVRKVKTSAKEYTNGYRSGTWTPVLQFGGGNTGMTGTFSGEWREDGNSLVAQGYISLTAKGSSSGAATISMPPSNGFVLPAGGGAKFGTMTFASQSGVTTGIAYGLINNEGVLTAQLLDSVGNNLTDAIFTNSTRLRFRIEMPLV